LVHVRSVTSSVRAHPFLDDAMEGRGGPATWRGGPPDGPDQTRDDHQAGEWEKIGAPDPAHAASRARRAFRADQPADDSAGAQSSGQPFFRLEDFASAARRPLDRVLPGPRWRPAAAASGGAPLIATVEDEPYVPGGMCRPPAEQPPPPLFAVDACFPNRPRSPPGWSKAFRAKLKRTTLVRRVPREEDEADTDPEPQRGEEAANAYVHAQQQASPGQPADEVHGPRSNVPLETTGEHAQCLGVSDTEEATESSVRSQTPRHAHREVQTEHAHRKSQTSELEVQTDPSPFSIMHLRGEAQLAMNTKGTNTEKGW